MMPVLKSCWKTYFMLLSMYERRGLLGKASP